MIRHAWKDGDVALVNGRLCQRKGSRWDHGDPAAFSLVKDAEGRRWVSWRVGLDHHSNAWQLLEMDEDVFRDYRLIDVVSVLFEGEPVE